MNLTPEMILGIAVVLSGCIAVLFGLQVRNTRRCERESTECRRKQSSLDEFIRERLMGIASESASDRAHVVTELGRARRVLERAEKAHRIDTDETPTVPARAHA